MKENNPFNYCKEEAIVKLSKDTKVYIVDSYEKFLGLPKKGEEEFMPYVDMEKLSEIY